MKVSEYQTHKERLTHWLSMGFALLLLGILLHFTNGISINLFLIHELIVKSETYIHHSPVVAIPINKQLYSFSYICFTGGAAGIVLSAFYALVLFIISSWQMKFLHFHELFHNDLLLSFSY